MKTDNKRKDLSKDNKDARYALTFNIESSSQKMFLREWTGINPSY